MKIVRIGQVSISVSFCTELSKTQFFSVNANRLNTIKRVAYSRGGSRTPTASQTQLFVTGASDWKLLAILTENSISDAPSVLDMSLDNTVITL